MTDTTDPQAERTALRDRIAETLAAVLAECDAIEADYRDQHDEVAVGTRAAIIRIRARVAVLEHQPAVLPAPADRAAMLETENARMRHELEVMYGGAFDSLKPATVDGVAEEHRLTLSGALGLGSGAPWDAIRERAAVLRRMADEAQQPETQATESTLYQVVGDWGTESAVDAEEARAAVASWLSDHPHSGAHAEQRIYREWPDGSEFYGPWTDLPDPKPTP